MRKPYTRFPLDKPHPALRNENAVWEPQLHVRVGSYKHVTSPRFPAVVDSGSPFCIFRAEFADLLGLDLKSGAESEIGGVVAGPKEPIWFHKVRLYVESNWIIDVIAGFARKLGTTGILGRAGFFDNFRVHFDHSTFPPVVEIARIEKTN